MISYKRKRFAETSILALAFVIGLHSHSARAQSAVASANPPAYSPGAHALSMDLSGNLRTLGSGGGGGGTVIQGAGNNGTSPWNTTDSNIAKMVINGLAGDTTPAESLATGGVVSNGGSFTAGQFVPFELTTAGRLVVADINLESAVGAATGSTTPINSVVTAGQYNTTLPTRTAGQSGALQTDSSGRLMIGTGTAAIGSVTVSSGTISAATLAAGANHAGAVNVEPPTTPAAANGALVSNSTTTSSSVAKTTGGLLYDASVTNNSTAGFLIIYNGTAAPTAGATLTYGPATTANDSVMCVPVGASGFYDKSPIMPIWFSTGIVLLFSTSCTTFTVAGTLPVILHTEYK
jgi:hypothetical protein